jgi:hypothetical protein
MTAQEWSTQWRRLDQFRVGGDADRAEVDLEWFAQLKHFHIDAVKHGITQLIGSAKDTFLPGLGLLKEFIQARIDRYARTHQGCQTCHGSTWIESAPFKSNRMIYEGVCMRCPDCGVPAPEYADSGRREALTSREFAEWRMNDHPKASLPEGLQAKVWNPEALATHKREMYSMLERLRLKLFGAA